MSLSALRALPSRPIPDAMIRRFIINPIRRWLGLPVHYRIRARGGHLGLKGRANGIL